MAISVAGFALPLAVTRGPPPVPRSTSRVRAAGWAKAAGGSAAAAASAAAPPMKRLRVIGIIGSPRAGAPSAPVQIPQVRCGELRVVGPRAPAPVELLGVVEGEGDVVVPGDVQSVAASDQDPESVGAVGARAGLLEEVRVAAARADEESALPSALPRIVRERGKVVVDLHADVVARDLGGLPDQAAVESEQGLRAERDPGVDQVDREPARLVGGTLQLVVEGLALAVDPGAGIEPRADSGSDVPVRKA